MRRVTLLALTVLFLASTFAIGQQTTGQISGTLTDSSGAVVANATVIAKNTENGATRTTKSSSTGSYTVTELAPGIYTLTTEAPGFVKTVNEHVVIEVGQSLTLNFSMKTGAANEVVTVTEEAPLIESTRSDIGGTVSPLEVKELPIVDRNFAGLMMTVPGVRPAEAFDPTKTRSGNVSVNGSDGRSIDYNVDGGDNKDTVIGGIVQNFTMEGIQEFQVITDRYTADSGRAAAAVVNVISKSGTNQLHGTAFGLFQNSGLNKIDYFRAKADETKLKFHRYQFGGSMGGAVIKDKLFFFGAYEQKREPGGIAANPDSFQGLSEFAAAFPAYAVPVSSLPFAFLDQEATFKIDHHISERQNMFYRYAREKWTNPNDQLGNPINADASQSTSDTNNFHDMVIQHNFTISPSKVNSFNVHFQDFVNAILPSPGRTFTYPVAGGGVATNPEICFGAANGCGGGVPEVGQNVNVPQQTLIRKYQFRDDFTWVHGNHNMKIGANWDYVAKMGGFFYFGANGYQITFQDSPQTITSSPLLYPQGFSTPGAVAEITYNGGSGSTQQPPSHQIAFYYQDDWKVTNHLTVNAGIRWDANPKFLIPQLTNNFDSTNRTINVLREVLAAGISDPVAAQGVARAQELAGNTDLLKKNTADWKEFQPRLGFSWDPTGSGKTVVRGGYGVARDTIFQNLTLFAVQETNPTIYNTIIDQFGGLGCVPAAGNLCGFRFGVDPLPQPAAAVTDLAPGAIGRMQDPRLTDPWSQQMSIGTEHQFGEDYALSADYYHVLGTHEPRVLNMNPKLGSVCDPAYGGDPTNAVCVNGTGTRLMDAAFNDTPGVGVGRLGAIYDYGTNNRSLYDGINFQLRKRMSHRMQFQASYVLSWSRSWGGRPTSSYSGSGVNITPEQQFGPDQFGPTTFDERHRFTLSGVFQLPWGFELAPLVQIASARPYDYLAGADVNGDGRATIDRACVGSSVATPQTDPTQPGYIGAPGCTELGPNSLRGDPFFQADLRTAKVFKLGERATLRLIWEFYNLTNRNNFCNNFDGSGADFNANPALNNFRQPQGYCGGQGGPAFTGPFRQQLGLRFEF
jgi:hypothetical protein